LHGSAWGPSWMWLPRGLSAADIPMPVPEPSRWRGTWGCPRGPPR
jgi:hypothetical protein